MNRLTDRFTWEEIAIDTANKFYEAGRIKDKDDFIKWFISKKDISNGFMLFGRRTYLVCYKIAQKVAKKDTDNFIIFVGKHGTGKSWLCAQMLSVISPDFNNNSIIYNNDEYLLVEGSLSSGDSIQLDEAVLFLNSQKHNNKHVTDMQQFIQLVRADRVVHGLCIGRFKDLVPYIRELRSDYLIVIDDVGKYKIIKDDGIEILNSLYPQKLKNIHSAIRKINKKYWWHDTSNDLLPFNLDWEEYRRRKKTNLENIRKVMLDDIQRQQDYYSINDISKILPLSKETIRTMCVNGELKGVRFGSNWNVKKEDIDSYLFAKLGDSGGRNINNTSSKGVEID